MIVWLVFSGWMANGSEAVFVEAPSLGVAIAKGRELFQAKDPGREFQSMAAEPLRLNEVTECDGWSAP